MKPLVFKSIPFDGNGADLLECVREHASPILLENTADEGGVVIVGVDPWAQLAWSRGRGVITRRDGSSTSFNDPFGALRESLLERGADRWDCDEIEGFCGGLMGFFGYGIRGAIESTPDTLPDVIDLPDMRFGLYDIVLTLSAANGGGVRVTAWPESGGGGVLEGRTSELCAAIEAFSKASHDNCLSAVSAPPVELELDCSREEYEGRIEEIRDLIIEGSVYQVNLTQRIGVPCAEDALSVYRRMRRHHPAPYSAFIPIDKKTILSSSPECFVRGGRGAVESRPIKGTIHRDSNETRDANLQRQLSNSEKDHAELTMIVDLVRNDLSRVCRGGTVRVEDHAHIESAPTVHHLVTSVHGELDPVHDVFDLLRAALPAGSITGAPKVRAMEVIDELEVVRRSVYTGAIGFIAPDGVFDLSVAIRTMVIENGTAHVFGGGGIVIDSSPTSEYDESLVKVQGLIDLLGGQRST